MVCNLACEVCALIHFARATNYYCCACTVYISALETVVLFAGAIMDAEWKLVQQKTFTRWCNEHLRHRGMTVDDLKVDFSDGVRLIALLEVLSWQKMKRCNNKAKMRAQKLENVQLALNFMANEKIKLVNIGTLSAYTKGLTHSHCFARPALYVLKAAGARLVSFNVYTLTLF